MRGNNASEPQRLQTELELTDSIEWELMLQIIIQWKRVLKNGKAWGWNLQWQVSSTCEDVSETRWKGRTWKRIWWNTGGDHFKENKWTISDKIEYRPGWLTYNPNWGVIGVWYLWGEEESVSFKMWPPIHWTHIRAGPSPRSS